MLGRHGTLWQVTVAIVGLAIVAVVLVGPRMRERSTMVAAPTAVVAPNIPTDRVSSAPAAEQATDPAAAAAPAPGDQASNPDSGAQPARPSRSGVAVSGGAGAGVKAGGALPSLPAIGGLTGATGVGRTLFSDGFESDPLTTALPTGWLLGDTASSGGGGGGLLGGLPLVGGLLGGGGTSSVTSLLPTTLLDGGDHTLARAGGSWSHLSVNATGGGSWADYSAIADVKPLSGSGFVGVGGRVLNVNNYLTCGIQSGQGLELFQVVNGQSRLLASKPLSIAPNVFHTVDMTMKGGQVSCGMDGTTILNGTTSTLTSGPLGLIALGNLASEFDNVRAVTLP